LEKALWVEKLCKQARPGGIPFRENTSVNFTHLFEVLGVLKKHRGLHNVIQCGTGSLEAFLQIFETLFRLLLNTLRPFTLLEVIPAVVRRENKVAGDNTGGKRKTPVRVIKVNFLIVIQLTPLLVIY
jgi:hypothetical protein